VINPAEAAKRLGVSRGALRRAGLDRPLSADEIHEIQRLGPEWLAVEQASQASRLRLNAAEHVGPEPGEAGSSRQADAFGARVEAYLRSTGLDYEIDEVAGVGGGAVGIKVGIYPWGKTILEGDKNEVLQAIRAIVDEVRATRLACPSCGVDQGVVERLTPAQGMPAWQCACGTSFKTGTLSGSAVKDDDGLAAWLIANGASLHDAYNGVWEYEVLGTKIVARSPFARPRLFSELDFWSQIEFSLRRIGFERQVTSHYSYGEHVEEDYWEGEVDGVPVDLVLRGEMVGPGEAVRGMRLAANVQGGLIGMFDGLSEDETLDLGEEWSEFWCKRPPSVSGWQLGPCEVVHERDEYEAARFVGLEPTFQNPDEATDWVTRSLAAGMAEIQEAEEECLGSFRERQQSEHS